MYVGRGTEGGRTPCPTRKGMWKMGCGQLTGPLTAVACAIAIGPRSCAAPAATMTLYVHNKHEVTAVTAWLSHGRGPWLPPILIALVRAPGPAWIFIVMRALQHGTAVVF